MSVVSLTDREIAEHQVLIWKHEPGQILLDCGQSCGHTVTQRVHIRSELAYSDFKLVGVA